MEIAFVSKVTSIETTSELILYKKWAKSVLPTYALILSKSQRYLKKNFIFSLKLSNVTTSFILVMFLFFSDFFL